MSDKQYIDDQALNNRPETVPKQLPGYLVTQQGSCDVVAAEQRLHSLTMKRILYTVLGILETLFGLRFILELLAANPNTDFNSFIYGVTEIFVAPLKASLGTLTFGNLTIELSTLMTMVGYVFFAWIIEGVIATFTDSSNVSTVTTSKQEHPAPIIPRL